MPIRLPLRLYWYLAKEVSIPFLGGFFFFMFVFLMFQVVKLADYFINHGAGITLLAKMTVYISAAFLPVVLPVSFLVATLVGFGRLSSDSEIVAMKASGVSLYRMYIPVAFLSVIVASAIFYLTYYYIPWGTREFKKTIVKLGNTKVVSNLKEGTFTEGFFDLLIYADKVNVDENKLSGVFIYDERDSKNTMAVLAKDGIIVPQKAQGELSSAVILKLENGSMHRADIERNYYEKIDFNQYRLMLKVEEGSSGDIKYAKTLDSDELLSQMKTFKNEYSRYQEYAIEFWKRIALALTPLFFGILGVGLGVVRMRSVKSNAIFVAFAVVVVFWGFHIWGASLAERGVIPPWLAMQLPNLIVLPAAIVSFRKSAW